MHPILTLKSLVIISLSVIICSCSKKIHFSSAHQAPTVKQNVITAVNSNSSFKENYAKPSCVTISPKEVALPAKQQSSLKPVQPSTKKFIYKSGYKPEILKPRPFVPEIRYTTISEEDTSELKDTKATTLISVLAFAGALVLIPLVKRMFWS